MRALAILLIALAIGGCSERYRCEQLQSAEPECQKYWDER